MRLALRRGGWLEHRSAWLPRGDADAALSALRDELRWERRAVVLFGRSVLQPRLIAWAGACSYRYSGQSLEPRPFAPTLVPLLDRVRAVSGVPFNHVLANRYRDGRDSMGWHADDEPELGDDPVVATLSLGVTRRFVVKPRRKEDGPSLTLGLAHGSLLVMGGSCQRHYLHGIPKEPRVNDERISLTFRWLRREPLG